MNNVQGQAAIKACKKRKKNLAKKQTYTCEQCRNTNRLVINREFY